MPRHDSFGIHLFKSCAAIVDLLSWDHFQALALGNRLLAAMGFKVTDNHVLPPGFKGLRVFQHLVSLADAGSIAHINFELPTPLIGHFLLGKIRTSIPRDFCTSLSTLLPRIPDQNLELWLCPMKSCVILWVLANSRIVSSGSLPWRIWTSAPAVRARASFWSRTARSTGEISG